MLRRADDHTPNTTLSMAESIRKPPGSEPPVDPFLWGSRLRHVETPDGGRLEEIPLTPEDVLDPQDGDTTFQGAPHGVMVRRLGEMLDAWFRGQRRPMAVFNGVKMRWGIPGLPEVAPDVALVPGGRDAAEQWITSYAVAATGTPPCLVIEVVSRRYAELDYDRKVKIYDRAGVAEYLIVDIEERPLDLLGYRRGPNGRFREGTSRRRWLSRTTGLLFTAGAAPLDLKVHDSATGERLLTTWELTQARQAAEKIARTETAARRAAEDRAAAALRRAEKETAARRALEAELERLRRQLGQ